MMRMRMLFMPVLALLATWSASSALAQPYPVRPVRIVVPFAAGGAADIVGRLLAEEMRKDLGVAVMVENRGGANGLIGTEAVATAAPDGYTLLFGTNTTNAAAPALFKQLPFDPAKAFRAVALVARTPFVLVVRGDGSMNTLGELVAFMKQNPAAANYAYSNSTAQVAGAFFAKQANVPMTAVPYKGEAAAITDVVVGEVAFAFASVAAVRPFLDSKRVRALAVTSRARSALLPDIPSIVEAGFPDAETVAWAAVFAPAGTPDEIVQRQSASLERALAQPAMKRQLARHGSEVDYLPLQKTDEFVRDQFEVWGAKIRAAGIEPQ
ncbi:MULTISPECIES: Bug family tripartite tricarboxylate transporter substrate binding protein [Achromobacter]|uniref:Bug family tripartite tricarboxylate transporter substrate binding protein n=1 Tax=Achromobacter sp. ACM03 TaxID=2769300 RepID=UPI00178018DA|nr:tripartite tricarboxylate transporter substrate-binding protein [Achromobacter sp. ACM03]MBD9433537.1 tripartite tricarboxylate transporter substrate binding protein [Achromobacter sp. ACM03]